MESLNDKMENLQNQEVVLLLCVLLPFKVAFFFLKISTNADFPVTFLPPLAGRQVMSDLQMQQMRGCFAVQLVCNHRCHTELFPLLFKGAF